MDESRLQEIEKRATAADTHEAWSVIGNTVYFTKRWWVAFLGALPVANFVAHSRQDVLDLLAEVRRLHSEQDDLIATLKGLCPPVEGTAEENAALVARLEAEARR